MHATLAYHWARVICMIHCAETIKRAAVRRRPAGDRPGGSRRAPPRRRGDHRGPARHADPPLPGRRNDQVTAANLIVSTTNNNEAMNRSVTKVAMDDLSGHEITEGLLNHIEVAIRAYDPCLSCATHALGDMPLIVTLEDAERRGHRHAGEGMSVTEILPEDAAPAAIGVTQRRVLVLGFGNPGREDDGLGPAFAAADPARPELSASPFATTTSSSSKTLSPSRTPISCGLSTPPEPQPRRDEMTAAHSRAPHLLHHAPGAAGGHPRAGTDLLRQVAGSLSARHSRI